MNILFVDVDRSLMQVPYSKVQCWAKALYDFEGHSEAELTFTAGEAIGIFDPDPAQEWWFGETEAGVRWHHIPLFIVYVLACFSWLI